MGPDDARDSEGLIACRGCEYVLTGLVVGVCPECGRGFDPGDARSVLSARQLRRRAWRPARNWMWWVLGIALIVALTVAGVIPRPASGLHGGVGLWVWMGKGYGVQRVDRTTESLRVHRWGNTVRKIEAVDPWSSSVTVPLWMLERFEGDRWRLEVSDPRVRWQSVLLGLNTMRSDAEMFGVAIDESARDEAGQIFEVEGESLALLREMIRVYGMEVTPWLTSPTDSVVLVVDPQSGELIEIPAARAVEMGIEVMPYRSWGASRIELMW